ncbi:MAG: DEAD/DEAH box helicase [Actinobacteria bacterium]|uniref:Unannotated protein n=1 Tax=freshwater metagenome TaxID=449393 RepID=A0A6J5YYE7_9ZZZZ|nr:DEAD/DEAH box helicase [Actinomycetota bacterium]
MEHVWGERLREQFGRDLDLRVIPARTAELAAMPEWLDASISVALTRRGIHELFAHQLTALNEIHQGNNVVIATGTASGKSLTYQVPMMQAVVTNPKARALYLAPTKALARDQERALTEFGLPQVNVCAYDGDSDQGERKFARDMANILVTNPDMLHHSMLPGHSKWASYFRNLEVIAVDECHTYKGIFGAHVSNVLKRLIRVCESYGSTPIIVMASATLAEPHAHAHMLTGQTFTPIVHDTSARSSITIGLTLPEPTLGTSFEGDVVRKTAIAQGAGLLTELVQDRIRTLVFLRSRKAVETVATITRESLSQENPELTGTVTSYRGGYLPEERRDIERRLRSGEILGLATTNALELGIDISGLDAAVLTGWPGSRASFWQQVGRVGRDGTDGLVVMIASDNPMDHYLVTHPEHIYGAAVEAAVCDPTNPLILAGHLTCAAAEIHLTDDEISRFGPLPLVERVLAELCTAGLLKKRPTGWYWNGRSQAHSAVDIRGAGKSPIRIVDTTSGQMLGTVEAASACRQAHEGAVYVHLGETFLVEQLLLDEDVALVNPTNVDYSTYAREISNVAVVETDTSCTWGAATLHRGIVDVTEQVIGYQKRRNLTSQIIGDEPLDLPEQTLRTQAMWWTVPQSVMNELQIGDVAGCVHAAEHAAIGMLPLFTLCDRADIGGMSMAEHPDTGMPTVFIYDGHLGGAGFAYRGYELASQWLGATHDTIAACSCSDGCPWCVQSPKCGNNNSPLDKQAAARLLNFMAEQSRV